MLPRSRRHLARAIDSTRGPERHWTRTEWLVAITGYALWEGSVFALAWLIDASWVTQDGRVILVLTAPEYWAFTCWRLSLRHPQPVAEEPSESHRSYAPPGPPSAGELENRRLRQLLDDEIRRTT